ncbi:unnamed protein product [Heligmosomoides polygyrus]|uniref:7TM_GPCR_Srx domain-containing protein n=1 Tax=Heligmosomoides polygyrus TaxID=6339 RepID=A0A183GMQ9_HELPZ|nr:unnamed protein product [Heligmosomoides polygyrus]
MSLGGLQALGSLSTIAEMVHEAVVFFVNVVYGGIFLKDGKKGVKFVAYHSTFNVFARGNNINDVYKPNDNHDNNNYYYYDNRGNSSNNNNNNNENSSYNNQNNDCYSPSHSCDSA